MVIFLMALPVCDYIMYFFFLCNFNSLTVPALEKSLCPIARDQIKNLNIGGEDEG